MSIAMAGWIMSAVAVIAVHPSGSGAQVPVRLPGPPGTPTTPGTPPPVEPPSAASLDTTPIPGPPVRRLETAQAVSDAPLAGVNSVRALGNGHVLVNDGTRRRLLLLDSTLAVVNVVLDSLTEVANAYGTRAGSLVAGRGDTTLFIDPTSLAMLVLDGQGRIVRVRAVPRAQDLQAFTAPGFNAGVPGVDADGRLVYRIAATAAAPAVAPPPGMPWIPQPPDSAFVVGVRLETRRVDTLGVVRIPRTVFSVRVEPDGGWNINTVPNPLPLTDDWALLPDGTVAFLRGVDYRVEFRASDGAITSGEKMPFPWVRMDDDSKGRFADSAKAVQVRSAQVGFATQMIAWSNLVNKPYPASFTPPDDYVPPPGLPQDWILPKGVSFPANYVPACPPGMPAPSPGQPPVEIPASAGGGPGPDGTPRTCTSTYFSGMYGQGYTPPAPVYRAPTLVRPSDLPDYKPPFAQGALRADADGRLWVRTLPMRPQAGGLVYDIIDRSGTLTDRLQLPPGHTVVGFGPDRVVFTTYRDAGGARLARVRWR